MFSIPVSYNWKSKREKIVAIVRYSSAKAKLRCGEEKALVKKKEPERGQEPEKFNDKLTVDLSSSSCPVQTAQSTAPVLSSPMCRGIAQARRSTNPRRWSRRGKWKSVSCLRPCRAGYTNLHTSRSCPVRCEGCAMPRRRKDGGLP